MILSKILICTGINFYRICEALVAKDEIEKPEHIEQRHCKQGQLQNAMMVRDHLKIIN